MAGVRLTDLQSRPMEFLDFTSLTLNEFQALVLPFETAFQTRMAAWRMDGKPLPVNFSVIMCIYAAACWGNHSCSHCWLSSTTLKMPSALLPVGLQLIPLCF